MSNQTIDLVDGYASVETLKESDVDGTTMTLRVGGKKNYKNRREDRWVHGSIVIDRTEITHLAIGLWAVIAMEEKKVARMRRSMRGEA